jgi:hypothetical protein
VSGRREGPRRGQSRGAGADDRNITHLHHSIFATADFPCAMHANPK